jgi:hypothetical protein
VNLPMRARLHPDRLVVRIVQNAGAALHGEGAHHVRLMALQCEQLGLLVGIEGKLYALW